MRPTFLLCVLMELVLVLQSQPAASTKVTKTYTMQTADGPVTVTETKITEVSPAQSGGVELGAGSAWSAGAQQLLKGSNVGDMSMGDLGGSLVLVIDKTAVSKGIKKYIMDAIKKLPVATKGIKIGFIEYSDHPNTVVSLKQGWSLDRVMKRLQRELSTKRHPKKGGKIFDFVGLQAAYNELQKFGKATAPRIVVLVSSGKDANANKTEQWRLRLMKEWISLSEVYVDTSSGNFSVIESGEATSPGKPLHKGTFLTSLLKSYSHSTIEHYKKIYGEVWEFYIVLKHYKKIYPKHWTAHLKIWFKKKYGNTTKFATYLKRTNSKVGTISPEVTTKIMFKKKYGANWQKYFLIWKYKRLFGSSWKTHYEQHQFKQKYGKDWLSEWEKQPFKNKYGNKWEPHYVKWYFKKYRGLKWRYSWVKWQLRQKHKEGSMTYVDEFMRWYYKYTKKGDKAYLAWQNSVKGLTSDQVERKYRWFYYNLVFAKRPALIKYTKWLYRKKYGKGFKPKYLAWLAKLKHKSHWKKYYKEYQLKLKYGKEWRLIWYRRKYKKNWRVHYKRFLFQRRYGKAWQIPYERWYFSNKYIDPEKALSLYSKWLTKYQLNFYKKKYGKLWTVNYNT